MTDPQKIQHSWWVGLNRERFTEKLKEHDEAMRQSRFGLVDPEQRKGPGRPSSTRVRVSD